MEYFFLGLLGFRLFFLFLSNLSSPKSVLKTKEMSDCDSESIHSESERSSDDSDSEGSIADFVADSDEEPEVCLSCKAEICRSNVINRKRRHESSSYEEASDDEESDSDSSSDYAPSQGDCSSSDGSDFSDAGSDADC